MKISVCVPTFNSAAYIRDCLESVLIQKGAEFELIVSDNASEDGSWEIIRSFSDPRVRVFRSEQNRGMAANFNRTLHSASGEYVKLLCADDLLEPGALELQARFLDENPEITMVTGATRLIDSNSKVCGVKRYFGRPVKIDALNLRALSLIHGNVVGEPSAVLFRRETWLRAGPFRTGLATLIDLDMWLRLSRGGGVGYLPLPLCRIRRHALSMTTQFRMAGEVQETVLRLTEAMLGELQAGSLVRRISLGKVAGSHLRHALYGFRRGLVSWPAASLALAFRIDPLFFGLLLYLAFFRSGLVGLRVGSGGRPSVCLERAWRCLEQRG
jgi:cellulose synthase/poly-beta-1,6-N-acetylglucosamine synthase-like glycosyltransferase